MTRRRSLATVAAGGLCLATAGIGVTTAGSATAAEEPGSGFQSISLVAEAGGERVIFTAKATGQPDGFAEADTPFAQATMGKSTGRALSSIAWPGSAGGNLGSLILLTSPDAPKETTSLNSPVRAEAQRGSGSPSVVNDDYPGALMKAEANDSLVGADTSVQGAEVPGAGTIGNSRTTSTVKLTGKTAATAEATALITDIAFAEGAVKIGSVSSIAKGATDGLKAKSEGRTVVSDVTIGGVPVTVDEKGVHVADQGTALTPATEVVKTVLKQFTIDMRVTEPSQTTKAGSTTFDSGSLIVSLNADIILVFGGAKITAAATNSTPFTFNAPPPIPFNPGTPAGGGTTGGVIAPADPGTGTGSLDAPVGDVPAPAVAGDAPAPETAPLELAAEPRSLPSGLNPGWVVLAVLGAGLIAGGLRRMPDQVLNAVATPCPLGDGR